MATIQVYDRASGRIDGEAITIGSLEKPVTLTVTGNVHRRTETIANGANATLYSDELGSFTYLHVTSDFNTRALITDNTGNTFSVTLRGTGESNKYGIGLQLGDDSTSNSNTRINAVQVFNTSGNSAKASIIVIE